LLKWRYIGPVRGARVVAVSSNERDLNRCFIGGVASGVEKTTHGAILG
jgi:hypothetical protein